jgi:hypothetical protein
MQFFVLLGATYQKKLENISLARTVYGKLLLSTDCSSFKHCRQNLSLDLINTQVVNLF